MDKTIIELYKKEILLFLGTMDIYLGDIIINTNEETNKLNKAFIKQKMNEIYSGNLMQEEFDKAVDDLMPYLRQKSEQ